MTPPWRRPGLLGLVFVGGAMGTFARASLESAFGAGPGAWPWATFAINVSGAFVLGLLLTLLARAGADDGWRRGVRLGVGTGLLGGFTTYSTLAVEAVTRLPWLGMGYALVSVVVGVAAAAAGRACGRLGLKERV